MADETVVEATEEVVEEVESEEVETEAVEEAEPGAIDEEEAAEDEFVVSIGEDSPPQEAEGTELVRHLRESLKVQGKEKRTVKDENRDLRARLDSYEKKDPVTLGAKPTLEASGEGGYDSDIYEKDLAAWYDRKALVDKQTLETKEATDIQTKEWNSVLTSYEAESSELKIKTKGFDDAEETAKEILSTVQQGMILQGSDKPALLVLALGKNPQKARELASIKDPAKFIWAVAQMETQLKVSGRKAATSPEKKVVSKGGSANPNDSTLEGLERAAAKTGDRSKVIQYKRQKKRE